MGAKGELEREAKFGCRPGFVMPDLRSVLPGGSVQTRPALDLDATYIDTPDLRLVRSGVSLRRRTGEGEPTWTLKLPGGGSGAVLRRREFDVVSDATDVPEELAALVTGWVRTAPLGPVIDILSHRERLIILDAEGREVAEIDDDQVTVVERAAVAATFREIEIELSSTGSEQQLQLLADALVSAGAGAADPMSKVARALGPRALVPSELDGARPRRDAPLGAVVQAGLRSAAADIVGNDHVIRLDDDLSGLHQARWGVRRLRADLRTFATVFGPVDHGPLRDELARLSAELGAQRDADVLIERLERAASDLDPRDAEALAALIDHAQQVRSEAHDRVLAAIGSRRHAELLDRIVEVATTVPTTSRASNAAVGALPAVLEKLWRELRREFDSLDGADEERIRRIRRRVVRLRCAAEIAVPIFGASAADFVTRLADVQFALGDALDAYACDAWLRSLDAPADGSTRFVAGQLVSMQRTDVRAALDAAVRGWRVCTSRPTVAWFRS